MKSICLTFDVEEFSLPQYLNLNTSYNDNCTFSNVGLARLLKLLKKYDIKSTFFITGYYAHINKKSVLQIKKEGHEIGCHAYYDTEITKKNYTLVKQELICATKLLTKINKGMISGFRAPRMAINRKILELLSSLGYTYDSSYHPAFFPPKYFNLFQSRKLRNICGITEIPVSVLPLIKLPISWWWFKNIGLWITKLGCVFNKSFVNIYFHPWEFADIPLIAGIPSHFIRPCGKELLLTLENLIAFCKKRNYQFKKLRDVIN